MWRFEDNPRPWLQVSGWVSLLLSVILFRGAKLLDATRSEPSKPIGQPKHILVVEDDGSYRWVIRRLIESAFGDEVSVEDAPTGDRAIERLDSGAPLDLVLLDLSLPGADGFAILKRLRADERTRRVPVIVVTSSQEPADVRRAYELGANSFVSKSDSPEKTLQRLRLLPIYWLELNRLPEEDPLSRNRASSRSSTSSARP